MRYRVVHRTDYAYAAPVALAHTVAHLRPRHTITQTVTDSRLDVSPVADHSWEYTDAFGNPTSYWSIEHTHQALSVTASSVVDTILAPVPPSSPAWEDVPALLHSQPGLDGVDAAICTAESPLVAPSSDLAAYAMPSFVGGRPIAEAVADLTTRIFHDFEFDPGFSTVTTPVSQVLEHRRGVCQDLAHVALGCLRSLGLPARYVSGYIETQPPPGQTKLVGADASHAWISAYVPGWGWLDADPTNDQTPPRSHITVAWGRDYTDVAPVRGVVFGPSAEQTLTVSVDVQRL